MKINRRKVSIGLLATATAYSQPLRGNPFAWILRFLFGKGARSAAGRAASSAVTRSASRAAAGGALATTNTQRSAAMSAAGFRRRVGTPVSVKNSTGRSSVLNGGSEIRRQRQRRPDSIAAEVVKEIATNMGIEMLMTEEMGIAVENVVAIATERAEEIEKHGGVALWISDEKNTAVIEGDNIHTSHIIDELVVDLKDSETHELVSRTVAPISIRAEGRIVRELSYVNVPPGPKYLEAYLIVDKTVMFHQVSENIIVVHPHEILISA